ncbi:TIGR02647 family protein [Motiliproteus coralliicola]|uniref:TIGR02647 family protein n=1 Tax=Motiliproteus coralliicola TaxID=2283196 RepID=A0A369WKD8_9GAMM|nr:TIGR02647 family protein [Motiliproteus coralliicola]RDE22520.1 TIGR02647 family protein [Motiliproteus coralliicola]
MSARFPAETIAELELLARFSLNSLQSGLKIHHDAPVDVIGAAQRLFDKGMITQDDGGYLTDRGHEAAESLMRVLSTLE